ncbi:MAG: Thimet oligopeptidase [Acidobacteriales bacterium]|nr:Thimet oligopeptidase [Terriglobales bacterium]
MRKAFVAVLLFSSFAFAQKDFPGAVILTGTVEQFNAACKADLDNARTEITRLKAMKAPRNTMQTLQAFDNANLDISFAADRASLAQEVEPDESMRNASEKCGQDASALSTEISLDRGVYDAIVALDISRSDEATKYLVKQTLSDFRRSGVDRDEPTRARITALNDELTKIGQEFNKNIAKGVRTASFTPAELDGLPDDYIKSHPAKDGKIVLNTSYPDYIPFMKYAKNSAARERFYRVYNQRAYPENMDVLKRMMAKRYELATLLGYKNWADYATENKMIGNAKNAGDFIEKITAAADSRMKVDYAELLEVAKQDNPAATAVNPWDSSFYSERLRATKYNFDSQVVRPYLEYNHVKDGLFGIVSKMYGVEFRKAKDAKVWHSSVEAYDIYDGKKNLGRIYLDMFPRENKYSHAANFFLTPGRAGTYLPEAVLVCNFPDPSKGPALMEHSDVTTFFHEFGHTVHLIFSGQPKWSGYSFQWDFIEAPSQMFEEWTITPSTLQLFAKHYQTGEPIPTEMVKRLRRAQEAGKGLGVRRQMSLAALSLGLYNRDPKDIDTDQMTQMVTEKYTPFKYVSDTHFQTAFGHLEGYSAFYYTYMWSLVIARDILTEFQKDGFMNPAVAMRYRKEVLEPGASKPAAELITKFLGRPYNFEAYKRWLDQTE